MGEGGRSARRPRTALFTVIEVRERSLLGVFSAGDGSGPVRLAQHELLDLAGGGAGEVVALLDRGRALEAGEVLLAVGDDRLLVERGSLTDDDKGFGGLAPAFMGDADDGGVDDVGVLVEDGFDLEGGDVLAAGDDDVLLAVSRAPVRRLISMAVTSIRTKM